MERRTFPRHALKPALAGMLSFPASRGAMPAAILNVSTDGVGLYLSRPLQDGETSFLELLDVPVALRRPLELRIVYVRPGSDGAYVAGAALADPLSDVERATLLGRS